MAHDRLPPALRRATLVALGVSLVAASAHLEATLPGTRVPQSAQTLAVLVVGSLLGARDGTLALVTYLLLGALGVPVFADGASGWAHLWGPTSGYLLGFVLAAGLLGRLRDRGRIARRVPALAAMVGAHALILTLGWLRLAYTLGPGSALAEGVTPFLLGGAVKSVLAAAAVLLADAVRARASPARPGSP